ncbi:MAG: sulfotransferase family 2 domain-containing protein [Pseudomonadota bacterium]
MSRKLRWSSADYCKLSKNQQHVFAQEKALRLYKSNAIYSFIPKNACSTMRLSLALYNNCLATTDDFKWIHKNNLTFSADLFSLVTASYTFVILRCPYSRLASVYLDKVVGEETSQKFIDRTFQEVKKSPTNFKSILGKRKPDTTVSELSFHEFVIALHNNRALRNDQHWRPQVEFLVYKDYDDYFCVEEFSKARKALKAKVDLEVVDARGLTLHGTNRFTLVEDSELHKASSLDIRRMMQNGECPSHSSLFNDEIIELVGSMYAEDIKMYKSTFGVNGLLYS